MSTLILWSSNTSYPSVIKEHFVNSQIITNENELKEFLERKQEIESIIILAELIWNNKKPSEFYGFDIIRTLRLENKIAAPIALCSFLPDTFFIRNEQPLYKGNILNAPAHQFIQLPHDFKHNIISWQDQLDMDLLEDINYAFFDLQGIAREIIHSLQNKLDLDLQSTIQKEVLNEVISKIVHSFNLLCSLFEKENLVKLHTIKTNIIEELKKDVEREISNFNSTRKGFTYRRGRIIIKQFSEQIYSLLPESPEPDNLSAIQEKTKWEVLYVDDDEINRQTIAEFFERKNVICTAVSSADEVFSILTRKDAWKITIVIADIRLLDQNKKWQLKQGYQILKDLNRTHPYPLSYFVITSKKGTIIKNIQKASEFNIHWFDKKDVMTSEIAFKNLFYVVKMEGDNIYFKCKSQPDKTVWTNGNLRIKFPLAFYYKKHIEASDYRDAEKVINERAKEYIDNCLARKKNDRCHWTITHKEKKFDPQFLTEGFRNTILIGRRVALGLKINNFKEVDIFLAMMLKRKKGEKIESSFKQLFTTTLALSTNMDEEIPSFDDISRGRPVVINILEEEIEFLNRFYDAGLDIEAIKVTDKDLDEVSEIFRGFESILSYSKIVSEKLNDYFEKEYDDTLSVPYWKIKDVVKEIGKVIIKTPILKSKFEKVTGEYLNNIRSPEIKKLFINIIS